MSLSLTRGLIKGHALLANRYILSFISRLLQFAVLTISLYFTQRLHRQTLFGQNIISANFTHLLVTWLTAQHCGSLKEFILSLGTTSTGLISMWRRLVLLLIHFTATLVHLVIIIKSEFTYNKLNLMQQDHNKRRTTENVAVGSAALFIVSFAIAMLITNGLNAFATNTCLYSAGTTPVQGSSVVDQAVNVSSRFKIVITSGFILYGLLFLSFAATAFIP